MSEKRANKSHSIAPKKYFNNSEIGGVKSISANIKGAGIALSQIISLLFFIKKDPLARASLNSN